MNQGTNINLDIKRVVGYRQFCNKLWNAVKFALMYIPETFKPEADISKLKLSFADRWILSNLTSVTRTIAEVLSLFIIRTSKTLTSVKLQTQCTISGSINYAMFT